MVTTNNLVGIRGRFPRPNFLIRAIPHGSESLPLFDLKRDFCEIHQTTNNKKIEVDMIYLLSIT
jgi:hypothetical protein